MESQPLAQETTEQQIPIVRLTPTQEESTDVKKSIPLILFVLTILSIMIILGVYIAMQNNSLKTNNDVVSGPVISDGLPEVNPHPIALNPGATVYEGKMFNVEFEYSGDITVDQTKKLTYPDGTTWCMFENMNAAKITVTLIKGVECESSADYTRDGEKFTLMSKDGKEFNMVAYEDGGIKQLQAIYTEVKGDSKYVMKFTLTGTSQSELRTEAESMLKTLTFDTTLNLKTEIADVIVSN